MEARDNLWCQLRRLKDGAKSCLDWHSGRMKADPDYRAAVDHLTKLLSARPGRLGEMVRLVVQGTPCWSTCCDAHDEGAECRGLHATSQAA